MARPTVQVPMRPPAQCCRGVELPLYDGSDVYSRGRRGTELYRSTRSVVVNTHAAKSVCAVI